VVLRAVEAALRSQGLSGRGILIAASGGLDSTVLFHALKACSQRWALKLWLGHVNHGLRGAESEADQGFVEALGAEHGIPVLVRRVDPGALRQAGPSRTRPSPEEAARTLRRAALVALAEAGGADCIATAHHADDQAETVLLRLLRGTGPDGLGGMAERSGDGRIVRPLLRVPRAEIHGFALAEGLVWREDASNASPVHARNRLRHRWLPGLRDDFNPQLLRAIGDLAEAQRRDAEWIASEVDRALAERTSLAAGELRLARDGWSELPEALARRVVARALANLGSGRDVSRVQLERVLGFLRTGRPGTHIELPGGLALHCARDAFRLTRGGVRDTPSC
jgi:tRNA(Ile)-lysidine synthase